MCHLLHPIVTLKKEFKNKHQRKLTHLSSSQKRAQNDSFPVWPLLCCLGLIDAILGKHGEKEVDAEVGVLLTPPPLLSMAELTTRKTYTSGKPVALLDSLQGLVHVQDTERNVC